MSKKLQTFKLGQSSHIFLSEIQRSYLESKDFSEKGNKLWLGKYFLTRLTVVQKVLVSSGLLATVKQALGAFS